MTLPRRAHVENFLVQRDHRHHLLVYLPTSCNTPENINVARGKALSSSHSGYAMAASVLRGGTGCALDKCGRQAGDNVTAATHQQYHHYTEASPSFALRRVSSLSCSLHDQALFCLCFTYLSFQSGISEFGI